jgi:signal transduction histidine kinase
VHEFVQTVSYLNIVVFTTLAVVAVRQWFLRRDRAGKWAAISFGVLGLVALAGLAIPDEPDELWEHALQRGAIALFLLFPYLLYRFTKAFRPPSPPLEKLVTGLTGTMVTATLVLPSYPSEGESRPWWFWLYLAGFMLHWTVLSSAVAARLWAAGRGQPGVSRRRMRMLAFAAAALTGALFLVVSAVDPDSVVAAAGQVLALTSGAMFLLGLAPPAIVRAAWRRGEQRRLQAAIQSLMGSSSSREHVARSVLEPMTSIVGAQAVALRDGSGKLIGYHGRGEAGETDEFEVPFEGGSLLVWTSPYAPFFGSDELNLLRTLAALTGIALDRARLFEREREMRLELERADELKSNFVALAAHELRTPVTTIHGFVHTLHHLEDRLSEEQRQELRNALEQQTTRMAGLVEQLLDLSRLDAHAIAVVPQRLNVRERLDEIVASAAAHDADAVEVRADERLEATADPVVLERIVANLVTNALRYGSPPVTVAATRNDRHLRITVEDRGDGIPDEFVPNLFERFSRNEATRRATSGTGLGLAIARSYAHAHNGELLYESAEPHGARFQLVLPADERPMTGNR